MDAVTTTHPTLSLVLICITASALCFLFCAYLFYRAARILPSLFRQEVLYTASHRAILLLWCMILLLLGGAFFLMVLVGSIHTLIYTPL